MLASFLFTEENIYNFTVTTPSKKWLTLLQFDTC